MWSSCVCNGRLLYKNLKQCILSLLQIGKRKSCFNTVERHPYSLFSTLGFCHTRVWGEGGASPTPGTQGCPLVGKLPNRLADNTSCITTRFLLPGLHSKSLIPIQVAEATFPCLQMPFSPPWGACLLYPCKSPQSTVWSA